ISSGQVSAAAIAAPIACEINKGESGDYNFGGLGTLFHSIANQVAVYGAPLGTPDAAAPPPPPLTESDYVANLNQVIANNIQNTQSVGFLSQLNARLHNPVLNDVGVAKIQIKTAMEAVSYYASNPSLFVGIDPLGLAKYANNTPQLVQDLLNSSTSMQVSINIEAVIATQASSWASNNIKDWSVFPGDLKAAFITAFSTLGQQFWDGQYFAFLADGG